MYYHTTEDLEILEKEVELFKAIKALEGAPEKNNEYLEAVKEWRIFREKYSNLFS